jgi:cyclase
MQKWIRCLLLFTIAAEVHAQAGDSPWQIKLRQVTGDVYVAYRPDPLRFIVEGNVTIIINDADVVVVDGSGAPEAARQVIAYIRQLTPNPVRVLINTHGHGDHTLGNQEYVEAFPGVEIIARPETRDYMTGAGYPPGRGIDYVRQIARSTASRKEAGAAEIARLRDEGVAENDTIIALLRQYYEHDLDLRQQAYRTVQLTPPTLTFGDRLVLHRGDRAIDVRYLGPGDTHGDAVVYLPQDHIVITGDMVVHPIPYGFSRHPLAWASTLDSLAALDFDLLIPGHGDVQRGKAYLNQVRDLLRAVRTPVQRGVESGLDLETVKRQVNLDQERDRFAGDDPVLRYFFKEYFADPNVERTFNAVTATARHP